MNRPAAATGATEVADPRRLFAPVLAQGEAALLVDNAGFVMAGAWRSRHGDDAASAIAATLSGISEDAVRATRRLGIGAWRSIVFETEAGAITLMPLDGGAAGDRLLVVAGRAGAPLGALRMTVTRCAAAAAAWADGAAP